MAGGTVWVDTRTGSFDVFEADGTYKGSVPLPDDVPFLWHRGASDAFMLGDTIWLLRTAESGANYIGKMVLSW